MDLLKYIKGLLNIEEDPFLQMLKANNKSVNYYDNENYSYEDWIKSVRNTYNQNPETITSIDPMYELRNATNPYIEFQAKPYAVTGRFNEPPPNTGIFGSKKDTPEYDMAQELYESNPQIQFRRSMTPEINKHEKFHTYEDKGFTDNYWDNWNPFTSYRNLLGVPLRDIGKNLADNAGRNVASRDKYNQMSARRYYSLWNSYPYAPQAFEELGADIYAHDMKFPEWIRDEKIKRIIENFIRTRMNIWPDEVQ